MPYLYYDNRVAVTRDELIPRFYTWDQLRQQISRYKDKIYGIKRIQRGGGPGKTLLIDFDTLPIEIRDELEDPRRKESPLDHFFEIDEKARDFYSSYQPTVGKGMDPEVISECIMNASVLNALLKLQDLRIRLRIEKGISLKGVNTSLHQDAKHFNDILEKRGKRRHTLPGSERRFIEKMKTYKENGYPDLISKLYNNVNKVKVDEPVIAVLKALFAQGNKPTMAEIHRQYTGFLDGYVEVINNSTGEVYNPEDYPRLSDKTIRTWLAKWDERIGVDMKRPHDRQKYMTKYSPFQSLEQPKFAGSILSIDDRQPPFKYDDKNRMWFYNGIDVGSEAFTVWVWGKTKEGLIMDFYRQLIRNYSEWGLSLPYELECESSLNSTLKDTLLQEGTMFQKVRIEANKARAKRIEQYYRQLRYVFEKKHAGWLARPHSLAEANQFGDVKKIIPYPQLVEQCLTDIQQWNNTEHSKIKGKTRWEVFMECQHPELKPINYQMILPLLGYKQESSVKAGQIRFRNMFYVLGINGNIQTGDTLIKLMRQVEGKGIDIYWLDDNDGGVLKALIYMDGRYVCEAIRKPKPNRSSLERTEDDEKAFALMEAYRATVEGYAREKKNAIDSITVIDNRSLTLNNNFKIRGAAQMPQFELEQPLTLQDDEEEEDEVLETAPSLNINETEFKSTMLANF